MQDGFDPSQNIKKRGGPLAGLAVFAVTVALMIFVAAPVQAALGMTGLVLTELMLAGVAVAAAFAFRFKLREVFPFAVPAGRHVVATLLIWAGYLGLAMSATMAVAYFFPQQVLGVSEQMGDTFASTPAAMLIFISAFMPAVCEELLCRGFIQHTFRRVRVRWVTITVMAVLFGVLHLHPFRFLPTAILGFALAYLRDRSGGLALPMLFHFVNNCFSALGSLLGGEVTEQAEAAVASIDLAANAPALAFFYSIGAPLLIYAGCALFDELPALGVRRRLSPERRVQLIVAVALAVLIAAGFLLSSAPMIRSAMEAAVDVTLV